MFRAPWHPLYLFLAIFQEFHVAYVFIKMANSPRPGVFALERSTDGGVTWRAWQYFADTLQDCYEYFSGFETSITRDDSVLCTTRYSKVLPLTNGEVGCVVFRVILSQLR